MPRMHRPDTRTVTVHGFKVFDPDSREMQVAACKATLRPAESVKSIAIPIGRTATVAQQGKLFVQQFGAPTRGVGLGFAPDRLPVPKIRPSTRIGNNCQVWSALHYGVVD